MKIAIPINENKGEDSLISYHFGHVPFLAVYDSETKLLKIKPVKKGEGCSPILTIGEEKIDAIYCFGIGAKAIQLCEEKGIKIKTGEFKTVKEVIKNLEKLETLTRGCGH